MIDSVYLLIILFPIILLVQKIWVSYSIDNALRINHSKTYIIAIQKKYKAVDKGGKIEA